MRYYGIQNEVKAYMNRLQSEQGISVPLSAVKTINDRVEALKKSGEWSRYSLGFNDVDADNYLARAGVTDVIGRSEICWFTRGIKSLGLWQNMVSWPMRSYQNAGTGSTVYSLGGLGIYDGTMISSPTWGLSGVNFNGSNQRITLPNNSFGVGNNPTSIWAFAKNTTNAARMVLLSQGNNNNAADGFSLESQRGDGSDAVGIAFTSANIAASSLTWKSLFIGNTNAGFRGKDGGTVTQFTLSNILNKTGTSNAIGSFGSPAGSSPFDGVVANVIRISETPTTTLNFLINNLYKSTLGNGLGLP
jgi:hypothetical protein